MKRLLRPRSLLLCATVVAQKPSVSAIEEQAHPLRLLLTLGNFDATMIEQASLFALDGDYTVDNAGGLRQSSSNVTVEFLTGTPNRGWKRLSTV